MKPHRLRPLFTALVLSFCLFQADLRAGEAGAFRPGVDLFDTAAIAPETFVMVGDRGRIYRSDDGGDRWTRVESGTKRALAAVSFPDGERGWAVGQGGTILHSADGGRTWAAQVSGVEGYLLDVDFVDGDHGVAVGADSTVVVTGDGGRTWRRCPFRLPEAPPEDPGEPVDLSVVALMDPRSVCIAGGTGRIFTSDDGGRTWSESDSPLYDPLWMEGSPLYAMTRDGPTLHAVGTDGSLLRSVDRGRSWTRTVTGGGGWELFGIDLVDGSGLAVGSGGHVVLTRDGGATWRTVETPERVRRAWLCGVDLRKDEAGTVHGLIAGGDGTFGRFRNGRISWQGSRSPDHE